MCYNLNTHSSRTKVKPSLHSMSHSPHWFFEIKDKSPERVFAFRVQYLISYLASTKTFRKTSCLHCHILTHIILWAVARIFLQILVPNHQLPQHCTPKWGNHNCHQTVRPWYLTWWSPVHMPVLVQMHD